MKPFPCHFCQQPTLRVCRYTGVPNKNNDDLVACCKDCQDLQNSKGNSQGKEKKVLAISNIYKEFRD